MRTYLAVVAVALLTLTALTPASAVTAPEPRSAPPNCYLLLEQLPPLSPATGEPHDAPWVLCPLTSWQAAAEESPLPSLASAIAEGATTGTLSWWAEQAAEMSGWSLNRLACKAVHQVRSLSPEDPDDSRERSAEEVSRWWCETILAQPYVQETGGCDLSAAPSAPRPPAVRWVAAEVARWTPAERKALHDALKSRWPAIARQACPEMEVRTMPDHSSGLREPHDGVRP